MENNKTVAISISITPHYRTLLKRIIAERTLQVPEDNHTVAGLCREIIIQYLEKYYEPDAA